VTDSILCAKGHKIGERTPAGVVIIREHGRTFMVMSCDMLIGCNDSRCHEITHLRLQPIDKAAEIVLA